MARVTLLAPGLVLLAGCAVGPDYHRPDVEPPAAYRNDATTVAGAGTAGAADSGPAARSLGESSWREVFQDPVLQQLIEAALRNNYDVRIAAARVLQAQAQLGIVRADQLPQLSAGGSVFSQRNPLIPGVSPPYRVNAGELDLSVVWNLDFWGRYRRQTEAARAGVLASQWGQRAVSASVVSSVAAAYFQLRALDAALEFSKSTRDSREHSLTLTQVLAEHGSVSMLDVHQAEQLFHTAAETITDLERRIAQQENALSILLGENPRAITRGQVLTQQAIPPEVPAGLPSDLLERRPDIREVEENLVAANARIGVAKAAFFPGIALTGTGGFQSSALGTLFNGESQLWNAAASAAQPIFMGGSLRSGLKLARAQQEEMLLTYRQTVQDAFRQVSDALVAYGKDREFRAQQEQLTAAAKETDRLSQVLYGQGGASYLQVLTSETGYFAAELDLTQAHLNERLALVQLYNALGGGWEP